MAAQLQDILTIDTELYVHGFDYSLSLIHGWINLLESIDNRSPKWSWSLRGQGAIDSYDNPVNSLMRLIMGLTWNPSVGGCSMVGCMLVSMVSCIGFSGVHQIEEIRKSA